MAKIRPGRYTADLPSDGELVVFVIGMRVNRLLTPWKWMPVAFAMPRMLAELAKRPDLGLLGRPRSFVSGRTVVLIQYWRSFEDLEHYSRATDLAHLPAWRAFNQRVRDNGTVGIFHETYRMPVSQIETIYGNMPPFGLGDALGSHRVGGGSQSAAARLQVRDDDVPPVAPY